MGFSIPFNTRSKQLYNRHGKPFVLVNLAGDEPSRGDSHGYIGIAQRIAKKIGAEFMCVDTAALDEMYPHLILKPNETFGYSYRYEIQLQQLMKDKGMPDFFFNRTLSHNMHDFISRGGGKGIAVVSINESLPSLISADKEWKATLAPHHLTKEILEHEGRIFAENFEELPRPFIGFALGALTQEHIDEVQRRLDGFEAQTPTATFFTVSSHRTVEAIHDRFSKTLKSRFAQAAELFPVISFDYNEAVQNDGASNFWNPYKGLVAQADHFIVLGSSASMRSERLASGWSVHTTCVGGVYPDAPISAMKRQEAGSPFITRRVDAPDFTDLCADALIEQHKAAVAPQAITLKSLASLVKTTVLRRPTYGHYAKI